jgi:cobalt-zinc-cadmium resistance protein CzcA
MLDQLPAGALPKLAPISTGLGEIFYYSVNYRADAKNKPPTELEQLIELSEIQEYVIKPLLRTVPGIAEINESGGYERQFVVHPRPESLEAAGLTFSELAEIISVPARARPRCRATSRKGRSVQSAMGDWKTLDGR